MRRRMTTILQAEKREREREREMVMTIEISHYQDNNHLAPRYHGQHCHQIISIIITTIEIA